MKIINGPKESDCFGNCFDNNKFEDNCLVIFPTYYLTCYSSEYQKVIELIKNKYIVGLYEFPSFYSGWTALTVVHISIKSAAVIKYALYNRKGKEIFPFEGGNQALHPDFLSYIEMIDKWIANDEIPVSSEDKEFGFIHRKELNENFLNPRYYSIEAVSFRKKLNKETFKPLYKISESINAGSVPESSRGLIDVFSYTGDDCRNHTDFTHLPRRRVESGILLKDKDILFPATDFYRNDICIYRKIDETDVYADSSVFIIRSLDNSISQSYLYLYLISDTAQSIFSAFNVGGIQRRIPFRAIKDLPVVIPRERGDFYEKIFEKLKKKEKVYELNNKYLLDDEKSFYEGGVQQILDMEYVQKIKKHNSDIMNEFLTNDMNELNICYHNKAYKAALILAGSILEAVLIDWLSEIDGIDYFHTDLIVPDRFRQGRTKRADLIDYIDKIKEIKRPKWYREAEEAHNIRKKRNLVHAKLCIDSDVISADTCLDVVKYLKDVLKSRGI